MTSSTLTDRKIESKIMAKKKLKLEFAPGCFDHFDGTQEELDEMVAEIQRMFESGEMEKLAKPIDPDEMTKEEMSILAKAFENEINPEKRKLQ
jgi:hypothetical protein